MLSKVVLVIWFIGFLFTLGFAPNVVPVSTDLLSNIIRLIFYFLIWPLILGIKMGGG